MQQHGVPDSKMRPKKWKRIKICQKQKNDKSPYLLRFLFAFLHLFNESKIAVIFFASPCKPNSF